MLLDGCGPMLFLASKESWMEFLGEGDGASIYAIIMATRHGKGGLPQHIIIEH